MMNTIKLQSARITLRLVQFSDLEVIHELHSFPETDQYNTLGIPKDITETESVIQSLVAENKQSDIRNYTFAIENMNTTVFIGLFGLKLWNKKNRRGEIWYKIHPDQWGKGYATEAANLVLDFSFNELNLHRVQAGCAVDNLGSIKVLEKIGMIREGRGRQILPLSSGWSDNFEYAILDTDPRK